MGKQQKKIIRIALIGPESTGKSTLAEQLAKHYKTVFVSEHARTYLKNLKRKCTMADVMKIARQQMMNEKASILSANKFIFSDSELIIAKVWCEDVFKKTPEWIVDNIKKYKYDFYLLTFPDLAWELDELRVNPNRREFLYNWYERELKAINADYVVVRGTRNKRLACCVKAIDLHFKK